MKLGARDFLEKPLDPDLLVAAIHGSFAASAAALGGEPLQRIADGSSRPTASVPGCGLAAALAPQGAAGEAQYQAAGQRSACGRR